MTLVHDSVRTADAELHYRRQPSPGAPTLLLLHGITDGGAVWERIAGALGDRFDIVMPDARGHGRSSRIDGGIAVPTLAADTAALIEALDLAPALVWGHSMGAATAAFLAAERPDLVAGVILEDPPFTADSVAPPATDGEDDRAAGFLALLSSIGAMTPEERLATARRINPTWHADELVPWADTKAQFDTTALAMMTDGLGLDWRATAGGIPCPVLLITGDPEQGAIVTAEIADEFVRTVTDGRVAHIAGAGHNIHRDRYDETLAAAQAFLDARLARR